MANASILNKEITATALDCIFIIFLFYRANHKVSFDFTLYHDLGTLFEKGLRNIIFSFYGIWLLINQRN